MFKLKATADEMQTAETFMQTPPVSFTYDGTAFPMGFTEKQGVFVSKDEKLKCDLSFTVYEDSAAVEWLPRFTCAGCKNTAQIQNVTALDTVFPTDGEVTLFYTKGAGGAMDDFALQKKQLTIEPFTLESHGSRSHLPFFNLCTGNGGVIIGLGFTGYWKAVFAPVDGGIRVSVNMGPTDFYLYPGESVRNIRVLTLFWQGDLARSFNLLRNHLVLHYIPKDVNGEPYPPICCNAWGAMKTHNHLKYIQFIRENGLKFDCYWMDAGWHAPDHETEEFQNLKYEDWYYHQGDWRPNRMVHPDGIKPIADAAKDADMRLLLWFGAYICNHGIGWHAEHPEWAADKNKTPHGIGANRTRMTISHTINMDIPQARKWLIERIGGTLSESGATAYREDCSPPLVPDTEGRIGVGAMKSVMYLYEFWDALRERVPGLLIDNCGGGGSRIDLETIGRSYVLWRSDYNCHPSADPIGAQIANHGLGHFVPLVGGAPPSNPGSTYNFHSGLYGGMSFGLFHPVGVDEPEKHTWFAKDYPVEWHKRMLEHYQLVKPYLSGNFYALTPCTAERDGILAYQFDRPDLDGGVIFAFFRPECSADTLKIIPVLTEGSYRFQNMESKETFEKKIEGNTTITLRASAKPQSVLLYYRRMGGYEKD